MSKTVRSLLALSCLSLAVGCDDGEAPARAQGLPSAAEIEGRSELRGLIRVEGRDGFWIGDRTHPPHRQVDVAGFWIAPCETTQGLWQAVMGDHPAAARGDDHPVERVSWTDAARFCNRLSLVFDRQPCYDEDRGLALDPQADGFRMPSSAEWELACRGDSTTRYWWGADFDAEHCVEPVSKEEFKNLDEVRDSRTRPVMTRAANSRGLHDMSGNVSEWCNDLFDGNPGWRVVRGGSWADFDRRALEARWSGGCAEDDALPTVGFRIVTRRPVGVLR